MRSSARLGPIRRGRRTVPPSISGTPQRRQKTPKHGVLLGHAQVAPERELEPAGDGVARDGGDHRLAQEHPRGAHRAVAVGRRRGSPARADGLEVRARAEGAALAPEHARPRASGSASNARKASASAAAVAPSTALRASGRWRMTVVTGPFFSVRTAMAGGTSGWTDGNGATGEQRRVGANADRGVARVRSRRRPYRRAERAQPSVCAPATGVSGLGLRAAVPREGVRQRPGERAVFCCGPPARSPPDLVPGRASTAPALMAFRGRTRPLSLQAPSRLRAEPDRGDVAELADAVRGQLPAVAGALDAAERAAPGGRRSCR